MQKSRGKRFLNERSRALEAFLLVVVSFWITYLLGIEAKIQDSKGKWQLRATIPQQLFVLNTINLLAWLVSSKRLSNKLQLVTRHERDTGIFIGCVLPSLVLYSRFLASIHQESVFSEYNFMYAWISVSIGLSIIVKLGLQLDIIKSIVLVDIMLVTLAGYILSIEIDYRAVIPIVARLVFSVVWGMGQQTFPRSFTIGEGIVLAQGIALCAVDAGLSTISRLSELDLVIWPEIVDKMLKAWELPLPPVRSPSTLALQVGILGCLMICLALAPILVRYGTSTPTEIAKPLTWSVAGAFGTAILVVTGLVLYPWSAFLLDVSNPLLWLLEFVFYDSRRVGMVVFWCFLLFVCVPLAAIVTSKYQLRNIIARKLFHILVVLMFVPAYYVEDEMLGLSYGVALGIFMLVECIRAVSVPPFGLYIATFMRGFIDTREGGKVILTHTYLLLGCALPLWLCVNPREHALIANAGILSLGIGDAMGAAIGSTYGKNRLFGGKTIEGTLAIVFSIILSSLYFHDFHLQALDGNHIQLVLFLVATVMTSLLEAGTAQIDNLILPLYFFTTCNLVLCHAS